MGDYQKLEFEKELEKKQKETFKAIYTKKIFKIPILKKERLKHTEIYKLFNFIPILKIIDGEV